jgi:hypothetical protein
LPNESAIPPDTLLELLPEVGPAGASFLAAASEVVEAARVASCPAASSPVGASSQPAIQIAQVRARRGTNQRFMEDLLVSSW